MSVVFAFPSHWQCFVIVIVAVIVDVVAIAVTYSLTVLLFSHIFAQSMYKCSK